MDEELTIFLSLWQQSTWCLCSKKCQNPRRKRAQTKKRPQIQQQNKREEKNEHRVRRRRARSRQRRWLKRDEQDLTAGQTLYIQSRNDVSCRVRNSGLGHSTNRPFLLDNCEHKINLHFFHRVVRNNRISYHCPHSGDPRQVFLYFIFIHIYRNIYKLAHILFCGTTI